MGLRTCTRITGWVDDRRRPPDYSRTARQTQHDTERFPQRLQAKNWEVDLDAAIVCAADNNAVIRGEQDQVTNSG
jgi:hypothetical protein